MTTLSLFFLLSAELIRRLQNAEEVQIDTKTMAAAAAVFVDDFLLRLHHLLPNLWYA